MPVTVRGTDILFNDSSTQSTAAVVNTTNVLNATAGASAGGVGTYSYLTPRTTATNVSLGGTAAGSNLYYAASSGVVFTPAPSGTWRNMSSFSVWDVSGYGNNQPTRGVWLRIS